MTIRPMFDMMEATRLTREGRLTEAMALLRGAPPAADGPTTAPNRIAMPTRVKAMRAHQFCWTPLRANLLDVSSPQENRLGASRCPFRSQCSADWLAMCGGRFQLAP
jgi:hypothetical protein